MLPSSGGSCRTESSLSLLFPMSSFCSSVPLSVLFSWELSVVRTGSFEFSGLPVASLVLVFVVAASGVFDVALSWVTSGEANWEAFGTACEGAAIPLYGGREARLSLALAGVSPGVTATPACDAVLFGGGETSVDPALAVSVLTVVGVGEDDGGVEVVGGRSVGGAFLGFFVAGSSGYWGREGFLVGTLFSLGFFFLLLSSWLGLY